MAEKSQIATSIEQSKRLLKAGIDPESADMSWTIIQPLKPDGYKLIPDGQPYSSLEIYKREHIALASYEDIPAWSLSRLWDMLGLDIIVGGWFSVASSTSEDVIEELVRLHENRHANH